MSSGLEGAMMPSLVGAETTTSTPETACATCSTVARADLGRVDRGLDLTRSIKEVPFI
jgi:hypothetical protein